MSGDRETLKRDRELKSNGEGDGVQVEEEALKGDGKAFNCSKEALY